jgi:dephospho-CoA kinase
VLNVGLTGNVASGKSTVARHFAAWGATLVDADALVRDVQRPGLAVAQAIEDRFGPGVVRADGTLDRPRLRTVILQDERARRDLNAIVHPAVQARRAELVAEARGRGDLIVVNEIPLLFEVLDPAAFDLIVLVDAPPTLRRERLTTVRGLSTAEAERLIATQRPSEDKRRRSHAVIDNAGTLEALEAAARAVWSDIRRRAAAGATVPGASVVMVLAHPEDAAVLVPGTLRRCADAGVLVHAVCATAGTWPDALPIRTVTNLGVPRGGAAPDEPAGARCVAERLAATRPEVVVTFGPDGLNGHPDHVAVHHWTRQALAARTDAATLCHFAEVPPAPGATARTGPPAVALDVRPWVSARSSGAIPCGLGARPNEDPGPWRGREWFDAAPPFQGLRWDLLRPENAG